MEELSQLCKETREYTGVLAIATYSLIVMKGATVENCTKHIYGYDMK